MTLMSSVKLQNSPVKSAGVLLQRYKERKLRPQEVTRLVTEPVGGKGKDRTQAT